MGWVERRRQHDGSVVTSVYPKALYRKARTTIKAVQGNDFEVGRNPFATSRLQKGPAAKEFNKGLRRYTEECGAGPQYYFQNGFRKVR